MSGNSLIFVERVLPFRNSVEKKRLVHLTNKQSKLEELESAEVFGTQRRLHTYRKIFAETPPLAQGEGQTRACVDVKLTIFVQPPFGLKLPTCA